MRTVALSQFRGLRVDVKLEKPHGGGAAAEVVCGFSSLMPLPVFTSAARWSSDGVRARPQRCILRRVGLASLGPEAYAGIWTPSSRGRRRNRLPQREYRDDNQSPFLRHVTKRRRQDGMAIHKQWKLSVTAKGQIGCTAGSFIPFPLHPLYAPRRSNRWVEDLSSAGLCLKSSTTVPS